MYIFQNTTFWTRDSVSVFRWNLLSLIQSAWKIKIISTCIWRRPQNMMEWSEGFADGTKHHIQEIQCLIDHPISQPSLDISPIWTPIIAAEVRKLHTTPPSVDWVGKFVFLMLVPYGEFHPSSNDFYLNISGARPYIRVEIFNILRFCLSSRRWFVLCLACIPHLGVGTGVRRERLTLSIGPIWVGSTWRRRENPISETLCFEI
jgi:hypothetical protein